MILLSLLQAVGVNQCPECTTDCTEPALLPYQSNICLQAVDCRDSNIEFIYLSDDDGTLTPPTDSKADMESLAWWTANIDNEGKGGIRCLCVDATLGAPTPTTVRVSNKHGDKKLYDTYSMTFTTTDVNDINYDFYRSLSACGWSGWMAFQTKGCSLVGWQYITINSAHVEYNSGDNSLETLSGTLEWQANCMPQRCNAPAGQILQLQAAKAA